MTSFRKAKPNKWKRYNAWRAGNRAIDRARRLERITEKKAAHLESYTVPKCAGPRLPKAWARVRIYFADGSSAGFSINRGPHGPTVSPTLAGQKLSTLLKAQLKHNASGAFLESKKSTSSRLPLSRSCGSG